MDEAMSEASWTALAKDKERDWWSIDLEGAVEDLEVTEGDWEMSHQSDGKKAAIEE